MAHHAYLYAGERSAGIRAARTYAEDVLGLSGQDHPDVAVFEYGLFSVDDARRIAGFAAQAPVCGDKKLIVLATGRLFHEAQNALLKLFEEPAEGTTLVLIIPVEGLLLPTLRSRLISLEYESDVLPASLTAFLMANESEREKLVTKLIARLKSDKDAEKQEARLEAVGIVSGLMRAAYIARDHTTGSEAEELTRFLNDLNRFMPIMHERSVPLKMIFEHLLLVMPKNLGK